MTLRGGTGKSRPSGPPPPTGGSSAPGFRASGCRSGPGKRPGDGQPVVPRRDGPAALRRVPPEPLPKGPGRPTAVTDGEGIAPGLPHGLPRARLGPGRPGRERRTGYRLLESGENRFHGHDAQVAGAAAVPSEYLYHKILKLQALAN